MNIEELRRQYLTEVDGSSYLDYTGVKSEQYIQWLEQHLVKLFAIPVVMPRTSQKDYITIVKPTYLAKDGSIKMAREIINDIGETIRYEALKSDMYGGITTL